LSYNIRLLQDNLNDLINSSAKEYNHNNNNEDSENIIDKSKAENYNDGSDNSDDIDNDNTRDSDSSDSDRAYRCIGRQGLPNPISSQLKLKLPIKYLFIDLSDWSTVLTSNCHI